MYHLLTIIAAKSQLMIVLLSLQFVTLCDFISAALLSEPNRFSQRNYFNLIRPLVYIGLNRLPADV
jgi:hypothetical protein